jgi:hypothetical protein
MPPDSRRRPAASESDGTRTRSQPVSEDYVVDGRHAHHTSASVLCAVRCRHGCTWTCTRTFGHGIPPCLSLASLLVCLLSSGMLSLSDTAY